MRAKPEPWVLAPTEAGVPTGKENSQSMVLRGSRGQGQRLDSGLQDKPRPCPLWAAEAMFPLHVEGRVMREHVVPPGDSQPGSELGRMCVQRGFPHCQRRIPQAYPKKLLHSCSARFPKMVRRWLFGGGSADSKQVALWACGVPFRAKCLVNEVPVPETHESITQLPARAAPCRGEGNRPCV